MDRRLRVLYTINNSPQYILARSKSSVPTLAVLGVNTSVQHASVDLKICVDTICSNSPELLQDNTKDYSLYAIDPLESSTSIATTSSSATPASLAVGMGLMSAVLTGRNRDESSVNGTLVAIGTGETVLEVIFSLREVRSYPYVFSFLWLKVFMLDESCSTIRTLQYILKAAAKPCADPIRYGTLFMRSKDTPDPIPDR
jgi:hypothetical protein